jgi:hypothetical protein
MFPELLMNTNPAYEGDGPADRHNLRGQALRLFSTMMANGKMRRVLKTLKRKSSRLLDRAAVQCAACISSRHYAGHQSIPIGLIKGSEGRMEDFDDTFYPRHERMRSRWLNVASLRLAGVALPPVELIHSGGIYFVRDGHHRISVAKALGEVYIDAEVIDETC